VLNLSEGQKRPEIDYPQSTARSSLQGKLEMDIAQLPPDEMQCSWKNMASKNPA
jgi:hypothetical protein